MTHEGVEMALKQWLGGGSTVQQLDTITVGSHGTGDTFTYTINGKAFTYVALSTDTTNALAAAGLLAVVQAVTEPEFTELTFAAGTTTATITVTGPADGAPFTGTVGGTGTISTTTTIAPLSPSDYGRAINWAGGVLPTTSDDVIFDTGSVDAKYNLAALTSVTLSSWTRRTSYTGVITLPDVNAAGYREYRPRMCEIKSASVRVEQATNDGAGQIRLKSTLTGSAVTVNVIGQGASPQDGTWFTEVTGLPSGQANVVNVTGGSLAVCPYTGETGTVATLRAANSTVVLGAGLTLADVTAIGGTTEVGCGFTTLTTDQGATVTATRGSAGATSCTLQGGTLSWQSTGAIPAVTIGSDASLDLSQCPAPVTVGTITRNAGGTLNDPLARLTRPYTEVYVDCGQEECPTARGTGFTMVVS